MKRDVLDKPKCSSVRHIWTGAAPLSPKLQQLVLEKLAGRAVLHHSYGLTETTFAMFTCTVDSCRLGTPGKVTPGMECKVSYIILVSLSLGVKQLGHETDHSPPSSAKVKEWVPDTPIWCGAQLKNEK